MSFYWLSHRDRGRGGGAQCFCIVWTVVISVRKSTPRLRGWSANQQYTPVCINTWTKLECMVCPSTNLAITPYPDHLRLDLPTYLIRKLAPISVRQSQGKKKYCEKRPHLHLIVVVTYCTLIGQPPCSRCHTYCCTLIAQPPCRRNTYCNLVGQPPCR